MGINGGNTHFIKKNGLKKNIHNLISDNSLIIIDAHAMMYRYGIGSLNTKAHIINCDGDKITEQYYILIIALYLVQIGFIPVFIFDGCSPNIKSNVIKKRNKTKNKALLHMNNKNDMDEITYIKYLKRSYYIPPYVIENIKLMLQSCGIPTIDAYNEADVLCATIAKTNKNVKGIITDDTDVLLYGAPNILHMHIGNNMVDIHTLNDVLDNMRYKMCTIINSHSDLKIQFEHKQISFSHDNLIDIGCLMGTDYCDGLKFKTNKFENIMTLYAKNNMSIEQTLSSIGSSSSYIAKIMRAREVYKSPYTLNTKINLTMKEPAVDLIRKICEKFLSVNDVTNIIALLNNLYYKKNVKKIYMRKPTPLYHRSIYSNNDLFIIN